MQKYKFIILILCAVVLAACAPSESDIQTAIAQTAVTIPTETPYPSLTPYATNTAYPSLTPWPTYTDAPPTIIIKVVTATHSPTPKFTATITLTPTNTATPTKTPTETPSPNLTQTQEAEDFAKLITNKYSGFFLVNVDIAPGSWRSTAGQESCYWARLSKTGDILDNHYGNSGGTVFIRASDYEVNFDGCGEWNYLGP